MLRPKACRPGMTQYIPQKRLLGLTHIAPENIVVYSSVHEGVLSAVYGTQIFLNAMGLKDE